MEVIQYKESQRLHTFFKPKRFRAFLSYLSCIRLKIQRQNATNNACKLVIDVKKYLSRNVHVSWRTPLYLSTHI